MNILIVDDSKNVRVTLKHLLKNEKHDFEIAMNGTEALEKTSKQEYDVIFLDLRLPGIDGMDVLRKMRERNNQTPVIIITAYGTVEKAVESMKMGVVDFITKPFTPKDIKDAIETLKKRKAMPEHEEASFENLSLDKKIEYVKKNLSERKYDKAEETLKKLLETYNDNGQIYYYLGLLADYKQDYEKALKYYRTSLVFDDSISQAEANISRILKEKIKNEG